MYRDFLYYYHVDIRDVVDGKIPPSLALALFEGLPQGSMTHAKLRDEDHWRLYLGFDQYNYQLAAIFDAVNSNTRATGNFKTPPKIEPYPTPESVAKREREKAKRLEGGVAALFGRMQSRYGTKG